MRTMDCFRRFAARFAIGAWLAVCAELASAAPGSFMPIADQKRILMESVTKVLSSAEFAPHAPRVRVLAVGSWLAGATTPMSDLDATLYCGDPQLERRMVNAIDREVANRVRATGGGLGHKIKLIVDKDPRFDELFSGETGQKFVFDYCSGKNPSSCLRFDGERLVTGPTEEFWTCRGGKYAVPHFIDRPQDFIAKCGELLEKSRAEGKALCYKLLDAAKYADNVDGWLRQRLLEQYQTAEGVGLSEGLRAKVRELQAMKQALAAEQLAGRIGAAELQARYDAAVLRIFGSEDGAHRFLDEIAGYLRTSTANAALLDAGMKGGTLLDGLRTALARGWMLPLDLITIHARYAEEGVEGAAREIMFTLLGYSCPATVIPRLVLEVSQALVAEGIRLAGNYFVFDPLHAPLLEKIFRQRDPGSSGPESGSPNAIYIYDWEESKLRGIKRECLFYRWPRESEEQVGPTLDAAADWYVDHLAAWKSYGQWFADAGAGSIREAVRAQLRTDWRTSKAIASDVRDWAADLDAGFDLPAKDPFGVWLEGERAADPARASRAVRVGGRVQFNLTTRRELDELAMIYHDLAGIYALWGKSGRAVARKRVEDYTAEYIAKNGRYRASRDDTLEVKVTARGAEGWIVEGSFPWLPDVARGELAVSKLVPMKLAGQSRVLVDHHAILCRPTSRAKTDLTLTVELVYTRVSHSRFPKENKRRIPWRCELTARLERPPEPPQRIRTTDEPVRPPVPTVPVEASRPPASPPAVAPPPTPADTRTFDEQCGLAAWIADFEAKANHSGRDGDCQWSYRLQWTSPPSIRDGEVRGAFEKILSKRYDDGRVIPPYTEVTVGDPAQPGRLATVAELRDRYPQCWRGASVHPSAPPAAGGSDALASWKREFEKPKQGRGSNYAYTTRIEWTSPPHVKDGVVYGAFKRLCSKTYDDGRFVDFYPEVEMYDAATPGVLTTVDELNKR